MHRSIVAQIVAVSFLLAGAVHAGGGHEPVGVELIADAAVIQPGQTFTLGVRFRIEPGWHIYWLNPGDSGIPTTIQFKLPAGYKVGELQWPVPIRFQSMGLVGYGYEHEVMLGTRVTAPKEAKAGLTLKIAAVVKYLRCDANQCVPGEVELTLALPVREKSQPTPGPLFSHWAQQLPQDLHGVGGLLQTVKNDRIGQVELSWSQSVQGVEAYPATSEKLELADLQIHHDNRATRISYKPVIYDATAIPEGLTRLLLVYQHHGQRRGLWLAVKVLDGKNP